MNEEKVLSTIKDIKRKIKLIKAIAVVLAVLEIIFLPVNLGYRIILGLLIIMEENLILIKIKRSTLNILYNDCDPQTYYAVCHGIYPEGSTAFFDADTAYFMGDFQSAAKILSTLIQNKSNNAFKADCFNLLAASAFLSGDFDLCREACEKASVHIANIKGKAEVKNYYYSRYNFFMNFINGDYDTALKDLDVCKNVNPAKQKNSYRLTMHYYTAITFYYSDKTDEAKAEFERIINSNAQFYIVDKAKAYVTAIDGNTFLPMENVSLKDAYEKGKYQLPQKQAHKKPVIVSSVALILLIVIAVISILYIPGIKRGTAYEVISCDYEVSEICEMLPLNDENSLCIFTTVYDEIGVAYLKNKGDNKYSYCISYTAAPEIYLEEDNGYYITAGGKAEKVYFDITNDKATIPENSQITDFKYKDEIYYFYIFKTEMKNNFSNSCGVNMK